jgi:hypothetical protein
VTRGTTATTPPPPQSSLLDSSSKKTRLDGGEELRYTIGLALDTYVQAALAP